MTSSIDLNAYATEMFEAKSDVSSFSDAELLRMDSKEYSVGDTKFRVSVLETTAPKIIIDRKDSIMATMTTVAAEDGVDQVLLFVVDILREEATMMIPNALSKTVAEASFGATVTGDMVVLPGIMSRKKQIIPNLKTLILKYRSGARMRPFFGAHMQLYAVTHITPQNARHKGCQCPRSSHLSTKFPGNMTPHLWIFGAACTTESRLSKTPLPR